MLELYLKGYAMTKRIILAVSGSISAYKAADLTRYQYPQQDSVSHIGVEYNEQENEEEDFKSVQSEYLYRIIGGRYGHHTP